PDLMVSAATASPAATAPGFTVAVTNTVRNAGGQPTGPFDVGIYLSSDGVYDAGDQLLGTRRVTMDLAAGAASTAVTSVTLPNTLTAGSYFLIVRADIPVPAIAGGGVVTVSRIVPIPDTTLLGPYYVIAQVNATNTTLEADSPAQGNDVKATLTPLIVGPDLVVSAATPSPRTTAAGTTVAVTNTVRNAGGQATGAFDIGIYVSSSNVYDGGAQLLATRRVTAGLAPGAVSTAITSVALPDTLTAGPYFVIVRADSAGEIGEANENNNSVAAGVTVVVP